MLTVIDMCVQSYVNRSTPEELAKRRSSEADDVLNKSQTKISRKTSTSGSTTAAELDVFRNALTKAGPKVSATYICVYAIH
jgi:hypothetical protein